MTLLLTIFLLVFVAQLVTWIGKTVLLDLTYALYLRLTRSPLSAQQRQLKTHILTTKSELLKTSAQDQFAKWAKLRRSVDKGLADLEKLNSQISSSKSGFALKFNSLLWILTSGAQIGVTWWYRKQPVFYVPEGWIPGVLGWCLAVPFAPAGSVSVGVWQFACKRVLVVGERVVRDLLGPRSTLNGSASTLDGSSASAKAAAPTPNNTPSRKEKVG